MEDKILTSSIRGKIAHSEKYYTTEHTAFLDSAQAEEARPLLIGVPHLFFGGYDEAERQVLFVMPDEYTEPDTDSVISVIRVSVSPGRELSHRDYLGSVLGLGIRRDRIGDLIVCENGCDMVVLDEISGYILQNLTKIARQNASCVKRSIKELRRVKTEYVSEKIIVSSMRLDCIIAAAYNLSRSEAADRITSERVQINHKICSSTSKPVLEGDIISLRGGGRFTVAEIGGTTKKGRTVLTLNKPK